MIEEYKNEWNREVWFLPDFLLKVGKSKEDYDKLPDEEKKAIESILKNNRAAIKQECRERLLSSKNWQSALALYKLLADPEEYNRLCGDPEPVSDDKTYILTVEGMYEA